MKIFENADDLLLPNGKFLHWRSEGSYPFLYLNGTEFILGNESSSHMMIISNYYIDKNVKSEDENYYIDKDFESEDIKNGDENYYIDKDFESEDEKEDFLYNQLDRATHNGRIWTNDKVIGFWELTDSPSDRKRLREIIYKLENRLDVKIDERTWWVEFYDTFVHKVYFVTIYDYLNANNLEYGIKDGDATKQELKRKWHLMDVIEKEKNKKKILGEYKPKSKNLKWRQAALKSESKIITSFSYFKINEKLGKL